VSKHTILIMGAPGSGKAWLAGRITSLTGIPLIVAPAEDVPGLLEARHEWVALASDPPRAELFLGRADLIVFVRTSIWLRDLRLVMRHLRSPGRRPLRQLLAWSHGWDAGTLALLRGLVDTPGPDVMECASSEDVRKVLERVFGIEATVRASGA